MQLQKSVLSKYRELYPNYPLRKISEQTGIQQTRVFRIFNGQEMKISEYEKLREVISITKNNECFEWSYSILKDLKELTSDQRNSIINDIHYFLCNNRISNQLISDLSSENQAM